MSTIETKNEHVMVVPTTLFHDCGYFQGFTANTARYLDTLLDPAHTRYLPRTQMEQDPAYKQLIPYCIFQHTAQDGRPWLFHYRRGTKQGESRLHSKRSIGIGGHISTVDLGDHSPYEVGMKRELEEEVVIDSPFTQQCVGMINDDENEVGQVHLGIVHVLDLERPHVRSRETDISESGFSLAEDLVTEIHEFETWSQICLRSLF